MAFSKLLAAMELDDPAGSQLLFSAYGNGQSDDIHLPLRKRRRCCPAAGGCW
jgi:hypothetical protein